MSTVVFQVRSPWLVALALPQVARARLVVFFYPSPFREESPPAMMERVALRLVRLVNRAAVIEEIDRERLYALGFYANNYESDRYVDLTFDQVARSPSYRIMHRLLGADKVALYYKRRLLDPVRERTMFLRAAARVLGSGDGGVAVPSSADGYGVERAFPSACRVPVLVRVAQAGARFVVRCVRLIALWNLVLLAALPLIYAILLVCRRGIAWRSARLKADVVAPLIAGFSEDGIVRGKKRFGDDYLLGDGLGLDRLAFYFGDLQFTKAEREAQLRVMAQCGIRWFDPATFAPTPAYLLRIFLLWGRLCAALGRRLAIVWEQPESVRISASLLYHYLRESLFAESVDFKVMLEFQDYLSLHVVRTIVANERGRLTVGMHHNAPDGPFGFPEIRYVHINRYCLWGEEFKRLYEPHWNRLEACPIGPLRVDYVVSAHGEDRRLQLARIYQERYRGVRPLIVLLFPGQSSINLRGRLDAHLEGLRMLRDVREEFLILCRFRSAGDLEFFRRKGLDEILTRDARILVDMTDLTTYEWFALSDVVIVNGVSTGMVEAATAGKPCFSFDHLMLAEIVYGRYGRDIILKTGQDVVRVVRQARHGFIGWDCRWDQLAKDYCYFSDGRNLDRFRQVILDAVAVVEQGRDVHREETEAG